MPNVVIRLSKLAAMGAQNKASIEAMTGYELAPDGSDWVVYDTDPALRTKRTFLSISSVGLRLKKDTYEQVAAECVKYVHPVFEKKFTEKVPPTVSIAKNLGLISDLDEARNHFFWAKPKHLGKHLVDHVFPAMQRLGAIRVYPVSIEAEKYYQGIALTKISYLNQRHDLDIAKDKILNDRVLSAALPSPLEPLNALDSLLFAPPNAMAIPLHRVGSALLFTCNHTWHFPHILLSNIFDLLDSTEEPLSTNALMDIFNSKQLTKNVIQDYLSLAVEAINNLFSFLLNPLNFLGPHGELDELRQLKAHSLVRSLFADAKAINLTNSFHAKSRLTFQFIDKMANLILELSSDKELKRQKQIETRIACRFYSFEYFEKLKSILGYHGRQKGDALGKVLVGATSAIKRSCVNEVGAAYKRAGKSRPPTDDQVVAYFRVLRNLGHGTYLDREQFEKLFLEVNPVIPSEFVYLPWLTLLAVGLSPQKMLLQ